MPEYVSEDVPEDASEVGVAQQHVTDEYAMRRNTIAKPSYHWNSLIIHCYRRRILYKHNQNLPSREEDNVFKGRCQSIS